MFIILNFYRRVKDMQTLSALMLTMIPMFIRTYLEFAIYHFFSRRVAKAYARAPVLTVNGSDDGFDGFRFISSKIIIDYDFTADDDEEFNAFGLITDQ